MSSDLLSLAGPLIGVVIGGGISFVAQLLTIRHTGRTHTLRAAEERARWAAERDLTELKELHRTTRTLIYSVENFRIFQARQHYFKEDFDKLRGKIDEEQRRREQNDKRSKFEESISALWGASLFVDENLHK
jgi:HAMP domain-containing protein